ncbi:Zn-dependent alcohol dehydrogenase [Gaiella sp.]|uniref:Zn-dependent alcohol dehydrogenase n=1 Tax=Gaiella sp. TaxID=2663207 RepID=UPI003267D5CA
MRMRAAVLHEPGHVVVEEVELDSPRAGEVLVKVAAAGVCHSDLHLVDGHLGDGRWPMVLGHEGAGVVEAVGEGVTHVVVGDPVGFSFVPSCRKCPACLAGRFNMCGPAGTNGAKGALMDGTSRLSLPDGTMLQHGLMTACFAEHTVVDGRGAVKLPPGLPLWQAALLGCGVMTGFGAVRNVGRVSAGESVAVIGCGGVGLQVVAAAALAGAWPLIAIDRDPAKLEIARRRGATHVIDATTTDPREAVLELNAGGVDHAFEVVGSSETMRLAWELLRPAATAVVVGLAPAGVEVSFPAIDFLADKGIRGSYYGSGDPAADLPALAELAVTGELDLSDVVTHVSDLDGVNAALERLRRGEGARTVLVLDSQLAGPPSL